MPAKKTNGKHNKGIITETVNTTVRRTDIFHMSTLLLAVRGDRLYCKWMPTCTFNTNTAKILLHKNSH